MFRAEDLHWWYHGLRAMIQNALPLRSSSSPRRFLDVGCGTGANLAMLAEGAHAFGMDLSPLALDRCRRRFLPYLVRAGAVELPFDSGTFDTVLMMDLLYHRDVRDKTGALTEARRVLAPGGVLLVNVPAYQWLYSSHDEAIHTGQRFTRPELRALLEAAGFEPLRITYWNTFLFPAIALLRLWRRRAPREGSDLETYRDGFVARGLRGILAAERGLMRLVDLPFGLSIFAVVRKPG